TPGATVLNDRAAHTALGALYPARTATRLGTTRHCRPRRRAHPGSVDGGLTVVVLAARPNQSSQLRRLHLGQGAARRRQRGRRIAPDVCCATPSAASRCPLAAPVQLPGRSPRELRV